MKKLFILFTLSLCSLAAWAYDFSAVAPSGQTLYYTIVDATAHTVSVVHPSTSNTNPWSGFTAPAGSLTIPSMVKDNNETTYTVTSIGNYALRKCTGLTSVTIPNSVTKIGNYTFQNCSTLVSIVIPDSVTSIGYNAFDGCSGLTNVVIGNSVSSIGKSAFQNCSTLVSIVIPNSVTSIGNTAFKNCSGLTSVVFNATNCTSMGSMSSSNVFFGCTNISSLTIGKNVTTIPNYAFSSCTGVTSVVFNATNCTFMSSYSKPSDCSGIISLTIGENVTTIPDNAFSGCSSLTSVTIPDSVTSIGDNAFSGCSGLTSVTIPDSVTSIGDNAFKDCSGLTSLTLGNSVTSIGAGAFKYCSTLGSIVIPNSVTSIGGSAFYDCSGLTSLTLGNSVTSIGNEAFGLCSSLTSVTIPNSVTSIGTGAFYDCSGLTSLTLGNSVTSIGNLAFAGCSGLTSVAIPNSVTIIQHSAFADCSGLTSVVIPNSVTIIEPYAFAGCSGLTSVVIPNSATNIAEHTFDGCSNLKTVYDLSNMNTTTSSYGLSANRVIVPNSSGSDANTLYQILANASNTNYTFVNEETGVETEIPLYTIPNNFIYNDGGWKAKNIVLTDGQDTFAAPETFTAETATYTREFTNSNRSTLYLPFTAAIPEEDFEVYDFTSFANNTISFTKREDSIYAYTPYLVGYELSKDGNTTTCTITKTNAVFPKSESANYNPVTHDDMTFSGVISRTQMTSTNNYGYSNGFFVQSGGSAHVNPFRCYFTYTPSSNAPQSLPPTLNVEVGYGDPVGIDAVETPEQEYDGRYGKDVYDMLGRLVRKNADNLEGLPRGIYLWKGKKHFNN